MKRITNCTPFSTCGLLGGLALVIGVSALAQTNIPPEQWGTMQVVAGAYPEQRLYYPFTGAATLPSVVTCQFQTSNYSPGSYEAGYVSPGWIMMEMGDGHTDGNAIFDMQKPYANSWDQGYTEVLIGNDGRASSSSGNYVPGRLYTIQFTYNRTASTIQIDATGPTSYSKSVASNGRAITSLTFHGPNYGAMAPSSFGNVSVQVPTVPPPALVLSGFQRVGLDNVLSLSWTNNGASCVLESSGSLIGGWSTASALWTTNGNWVSAQVTNANSVQFFRLRSQ